MKYQEKPRGFKLGPHNTKEQKDELSLHSGTPYGDGQGITSTAYEFALTYANRTIEVANAARRLARVGLITTYESEDHSDKAPLANTPGNPRFFKSAEKILLASLYPEVAVALAEQYGEEGETSDEREFPMPASVQRLEVPKDERPSVRTAKEKGDDPDHEFPILPYIKSKVKPRPGNPHPDSVVEWRMRHGETVQNTALHFDINPRRVRKMWKDAGLSGKSQVPTGAQRQVDYAEVAKWRGEREATIPETQHHFGIAKITVIGACKEHDVDLSHLFRHGERSPEAKAIREAEGLPV